MINKLDYKRCTICQSCINICPKNCIKLEGVKDQFIYPVIDNSKCVKCGLCCKTCPVLNPIEKKIPLKRIYAARNLDENIRLKSSSGGIFTALAKKTIKLNGIVCGATLDENIEVKHIIIDNNNDIQLLQGSKYVQSHINNSFKIIKEELSKDRMVLFSGCPCQVAGLNKFLIKDYKNLSTVDFICHGIPSEKIFKEYIKILEKNFNSKVKSFKFRDKSNGWSSYNLKVTFEDGRQYVKPSIEDMYMRGFLQGVFLKQSCHKCEFKEFKSGSDITLGDYWGASIEESEIDDDKGLSLLIINSHKGEKLVNELKEDLFIKNINFESAIKYNKSLLKSSNQSVDREKFLDLVNKKGYEKAFITYCKEKNFNKYKRNIRSRLGRLKRFIIKKF